MENSDPGFKALTKIYVKQITGLEKNLIFGPLNKKVSMQGDTKPNRICTVVVFSPFRFNPLSYAILLFLHPDTGSVTGEDIRP